MSTAELRREIEALRRQLSETEDALRAIREGEVDAIVVEGAAGAQVFSLNGAETAYRLAVETMAEAALSVSLDDTILFCNARFAEFVATSLEQVLGRDLADFVSPEDRDGLRDLLARCARQPVKERVALCGGDDSRRSVRLAGTPLIQADGVTLCLVAADLSELESAAYQIERLVQTQAELRESRRAALAALEEARQARRDAEQTAEALRESETRYRTLFETMAEGFSHSELVYDTAGVARDVRCLEVNPAFERQTGLRAEEFAGRTSREVFPSVREPAWLARYAAVVSTGKPAHFEARFGPLGRWFEVSAYPTGPGRFASLFFDITARKQAEQALADAHRQTQSLIDNASSLIYAFDLEERLLLANTTLAELLNSTPDQLIGKRRHEFMPQEDADWHEANDREAIAAGRAVEFEEHSQLQGRAITWLTTKFPLRDAHGRIHAVAGISADISERKQMEEALRESEARYHGLFDTLQEGMFLAEVICDGAGQPVDYRYLETNPAFEPLTGLRREEAIGRTAREVLPGIEPVWIEAYGRVALTGKPARLEDFATPLGRHYLTSAYSPAPGQVAVLFSDVSERKRAEEALRRRTEELQTLLDTAPVAIFVAHDPDCRRVTGNRAAQGLVGLPPEANVSKSAPLEERPTQWQEMREGVPLEPDDLPLQRAARGEEIRDYEMDLVFGDGKAKSVLANATAIRDEHGRPCGGVAILLDVTEHKQAEEKALAAERARAEIAEGLKNEIAHRIKNNLAMVSGLLQMQQLTHEDRGVVAALRESVSRIRTFADIHERMYASDRAEVDLTEALRQVGETTAQVFGVTRGVEIGVQGDACLCAARTATNLCVIANELITNALKYGGPGADGRAWIRIGLERHAGGLVLSVRNSGPPVPEEFDPQREGRMGLRLVWDLVVAQYRGHFALCADAGGTLAEAFFPPEGLHEDGRARRGELQLWGE